MISAFAVAIPAFASETQMFYGAVTIDGVRAPTGTLVEAKIGGTIRTSQKTVFDDYGKTSEFLVSGSTGDIIGFYVNGFLAARVPFKANQLTLVDLSIPSGILSPVLTLSPAEGFATTITGEYFAAGTTVTIQWDSTTTMVTVPFKIIVEPDGTFVAIVTALSAVEGQHTISADDGPSPTAYATFTVPDMTGDTGEQGPVGPEGPQGPQGETGADGADGATGPQGANGTQGPQGEIGLTGLQGATGTQGETGPNGETGEQGPKGDTGEQGPAGTPGDRGPPIPVGTVVGVITLSSVIAAVLAFFVQRRFK